VVGYFRGTLTVDATNHMTAGENDAFAIKLNGSTGDRIWSAGFGGNGIDGFQAVSLAADGGVLVAGQYGAAFTLGTTSLGHSAMADALVARLNAETGAAVWATGFGSSGNEFVKGVAEVSGQVVVGAEFSQPVMFGTQTVNPIGGVDLLVGRLNASTGAPGGAVRFGSPVGEVFGRLVGAGSFYLITGGFQQTVDFGIGTLTAPGTDNQDIFAGMFLP
jgi:hypothetical protein